MIAGSILHYEILEKLGEGGMGEVYKAHDTKLNRFVALKFLPDAVSGSGDETARFIQEAQAAAALNHPNICTVYGIEEADGKYFIAMEFVDGQTLRARMKGLSFKQAIDIGIQVAEGLAAAHEKGIVHRDVKPENIMIRKDGIAQIMDFGLAKLRGMSRLTKEGSTVGTAGYMSPEQVQGQDTDHRSDIFSLGVLLFEMFTGELAFKGMHETAVAYEIVNVDSPPMSSIKPEIPQELDAIVLECLEKDPRERTQSAGQVALDLKKYRRESTRLRASKITVARRAPLPAGEQGELESEGISGRQPGRRIAWPWLVGIGTIILTLGIVVGMLFFGRHESLPVVSTSIPMPHGIQYNSADGGNAAISPDGKRIVFSGADSTLKVNMWVRNLSSGKTVELTGTTGATYPFWSGDSRSIAFFDDGKLKTVAADGGPVFTIADAPAGMGGAWNNSGVIVFSPSVVDPNLYEVSDKGGTPKRVTDFDRKSNRAPRFPSFLPDGTHFLFTRLDLSSISAPTTAYVGSIKTHKSIEIARGISNSMYASGYLLFLQQDILRVQKFDPGSFRISGAPFNLAQGVNEWIGRAKGDFSVSNNGLLLFAEQSGSGNNKLTWLNKDGTEQDVTDVSPFGHPVLSPDGTRIAYGQSDQSGLTDLWVYDIARNVKTKLAFGDAESFQNPVWSRDGTKLFFGRQLGGSSIDIFEKLADGSEPGEPVVMDSVKGSLGFIPTDVSPDGQHLLAFDITTKSGLQLGFVDLSQRPYQLKPLGVHGRWAYFSPDGKWFVYESNESGRAEVYVRAFGSQSGKWQVSQGGGNNAVWIGDDILYLSNSDDAFIKVHVTHSGQGLQFSTPTQLLKEEPPGGYRTLSVCGFDKRTQKYLLLETKSAGGVNNLSMYVNWPELIRSNQGN